MFSATVKIVATVVSWSPLANKALALRGATPGSRRTVAFVAAGIVLCVGAAPGAPPVPVASGLVKAIKVVPDKAPDCSTLKAIVDSVTRECKTNDEKMIAINNFMRIATYHRADNWTPAMKNFTNYGWALCGGLAGYQEALYAQVPGWAWRSVSVPGHNMSEAKYDGTWHWVDCFTKFYCWRQDPGAPNGRTVACHTDIKNDPGLVTDLLVLDPKEQVVYDKRNRKEMIGDRLNWTAAALLVCGDELKYCVYLRGTRLLPESTKPDPEWVNPSYTAEVNLTPGLALENTWDQLAPPEDSWPIKDNVIVGHSCGNRDLRNDPAAGPVLEPYYKRPRSYSNGRLVFAPDFKRATVLKDFAAAENVKLDNGLLVPADPAKRASVTVNLESPYLIVRLKGTMEGEDVSLSGLKTDGPAFSVAVPGFNTFKKEVRIEIKKCLKGLRLEAIVLNNAGCLPYLSPGRNKVTVSVADTAALGDNRLVVTYAYAPGCRNKSFEELYKAGSHLFAQNGATWQAAPTVVQKTFTAKDLPATFEIDVPTPKDKYPVYPRMLFLRREVLPPGGKPLPLPDSAQPPKLRPDDELKTLPNPFLIGSQPPPARPAGTQSSTPGHGFGERSR